MEEELDLYRYGFKAKSAYGPWVYAHLDHDCRGLWHTYWTVPQDCPEAATAVDSRTFCRCTTVLDDNRNLIYENDYLKVKGKFKDEPVEDDKALVFYSEFHLTWMVSVKYYKDDAVSYYYVPLCELNNTGMWEYTVVGNKFDTEEK